MSSTILLQAGVPSSLTELVSNVLAFTPRLIGAVIVLLIGWILGGIVARAVAGITDRIEMDRAVLATPIGTILGGTEGAVSKAFGALAKWFVYALAVLAAANILAISLLSEWIATAISYLPAFVAGLLVIVLGFVLADFIGDSIARTQAATENSYTGVFATGVKLFLYFTVVVIGLSTMGIDTTILLTFSEALAWGAAAAVAIGVGGAVAWGGKDFVHDNIDRWARSARSASTASMHRTEGGDMAAADGGSDLADD